VSSRTIDFNSLLRVANLVVAVGIVLAFREAQANPYVNEGTIALAILLCMQTHLALVLERRRRDPFIFLLAFSMTFYFSLRILTLTLYPHSDVFDRYPYDARDSSYALVFILIANVFLYGGFYLVRFKGSLQVPTGGWRARAPSRVIALLIAAICFGYLREGFWTAEDEVPRVVDFLALFFSPDIIALFSLTYYLVFRQSLGRNFGLAIALLLVLEMAVHTLFGSRSAVVGFIYSCLFVALALWGCIELRRKYVFMGAALLPVLVALLVVSFVLSTFNRTNKELGSVLTLGSAFRLATEWQSQKPLTADLDVVLPPIFSRAGFFDYSAEVIAHRQHYLSVINPVSYAKSVIDNVLTPGFDVFDYPKISNALRFAYEDLGIPEKSQVDFSYLSDQLGLYGEFYGLFGYGSLPMLFLMALILKGIYVRLHSDNPFRLVAERAVLLYVFKKIIDSYGMDWTILETLPLLTALVAYAWFFKGRRIILPQLPSLPQPAAA
jgi:hypothetical protein